MVHFKTFVDHKPGKIETITLVKHIVLILFIWEKTGFFCIFMHAISDLRKKTWVRFWVCPCTLDTVS